MNYIDKIAIAIVPLLAFIGLYIAITTTYTVTVDNKTYQATHIASLSDGCIEFISKGTTYSKCGKTITYSKNKKEPK